MRRKKRCSKGKSCGATCIENRKRCLVNTSDSLSNSLNQVSKRLGRGGSNSGLTKAVNKPVLSKDNTGKTGGVVPAPSNPKPVPNKPVLEKGNLDKLGNKASEVRMPTEVAKQLEEKGRKDVDITLKELSSPSVKVNNVDGIVSADSVNWKAGKESGAEFRASGAFGSFIVIPENNLSSGLGGKVSGEVGIKYGKVTPEEVKMLKDIGDAGAGPRLIAARLGETRGAIAMEVVPGKTIDSLIDEGKMSRAQIGDAYLRALSKIHRIGISHGDAHFGNVIIQPNGVGKLIDLGFAQRDPHKALLEALNRSTGKEGRVSEVMANNLSKIIKDLGRPDITDSITLRLSLSSVFPPNSEGSDKAIMKIINQLYEGV